MQGRTFRCTMEFEGHRLDESELTCVTSGDGEHWSIDVPTVLRILDLVAVGAVDPGAVQADLRRATSWDSGCCAACDSAAPYHAEARRQHAETVKRWKRVQQHLDPEEYPYLLHNRRLHRIGCQRPPTPTPPSFPEDLHSFALLFDGYCGDLERVFDVLDNPGVQSVKRVSVADVLRMIARDGERVVGAKVCGACKPCLPRLDRAHPAAQPACWRWDAHPEVLAHLQASAAERPSAALHIFPEQRVGHAMLELWHDGRCAICGEAPGRLVRDHDHASGLMRGLLCSSCNTLEGRSDSVLVSNYRRRPPSVILSIEVLYLPPGFRPGDRHSALMET